MDKAISIKNLSYDFRSHWTYQRTGGIKDITLDVLPGESFGFLGHNGAGKTTTIKCILNLIKPSSGEIEIFGISAAKPESRRLVGYLPEQPYFYDHLSVAELLTFYAGLNNFQGDIFSEISRVLSLVKFPKSQNVKMRSLSKGLTQRVGMAQALLGSPKLLILDEPFSGLDPIGRKEFADLFFCLKKQGVTMFISSHVLGDIEFLCDKYSIMVNGEIRIIGKVSEISGMLSGTYYLKLRNFESILSEVSKSADKSEVQERFLHLEFSDWMQAQKALQLSSSQAQVDEFRFRHGGLEELFMKLTKELKK